MKNFVSGLLFFLILFSCATNFQEPKEDTYKGEISSEPILPLSTLRVDKRRALYEQNPRSVFQVYDEATATLIVHTKYNCTLPQDPSKYFPVFCVDLIHVVGAGDVLEHTWVISIILEKQTPISHLEISSPSLPDVLIIIPPQIPVQNVGSNYGFLHQIYFSTDNEFIISMLILNPVRFSLFNNDNLILSVDVEQELKQLWFDFLKEVSFVYNQKSESL